MQGPVAVALGGWDLSWLAGGLSSAAAYALTGPRYHRKYLQVPGAEATPVSVQPRITDLPAATTAPAGL
jgi:toxin CptA